jgi:hypothetical protein
MLASSSSPLLTPSSPLTNIPNGATPTIVRPEDAGDDIFIINTNFNSYLKENHIFPCGRTKEERLVFTKEDRERVEKHMITPSSLDELSSLVCLFLPSFLSSFLLFWIAEIADLF